MDTRGNETVLFLLGAGASLPLMPSTRDLTDDLSNWVSIWQDGSESRLLPRIAEAARSAKVEANFEDLISVVDLMVAEERSRDDPSFSPAQSILRWDLRGEALRPVKEALGARHFTELVHLMGMAHAARVRVFEHIADRVAATDRNSLTDAAICRLVRAVAEHARVVVATLNFDPLLDFCGVPLATGYKRLGAGGPYRLFDAEFEFSDSASNLLLPMHGSIHLGHPGPEDLTLGQPVWFDVVDEARKTWDRFSLHHTVEIPPEDLMIIGRSKALNLLPQPFASYFSRFRREASLAGTWVRAGYGAWDHHINEALRHALLYRWAAGLAINVIVIDVEPYHRGVISRFGRPNHLFEHAPSGPGWEKLIHFRRPIGWVWTQGLEPLASDLSHLAEKIHLNRAHHKAEGIMNASSWETRRMACMHKNFLTGPTPLCQE